MAALETPTEIARLIDNLKGVDLAYRIDRPAAIDGQWWIDLSIEGHKTTVSWQPDRGFGIYLNDDAAFGAAPDEFHRDESFAAARLRELASMHGASGLSG